MTREKIEDSPLTRAKLILGAPTSQASPPQEEEPAPKRNIKAPEHKSAKPSGNMRRTTIYMPEELAIRLKVFAVKHREDVSGIITRQIEKLLAQEE